MKVLFATDGSKAGITAVMSSSRLFAREGSQPDLLCVAPSLVVAHWERSLGNGYKFVTIGQPELNVRRSNALFNGPGVKTPPIVKVGSPSETITQMVQEGEYDVTVVEAYRQDEGVGPGLGKVASEVLSRAPRTVLISRGLISPQRSGFSILVPIDGSAASERAVRKVVEQFNLEEADITLLFVKESNWVTNDPEETEESDEPGLKKRHTHTSNFNQEVQTELRREAIVAVERSRRILAEANVGCRSLILEGNPAEEIVDQAEIGEFDVVVMAAKGVSDLKHSILGSVSAYVSHNAPCSVAVVKAHG